MRILLLAAAGLIVVAGCSGPKPVLYPNAHLQSVGPEQAERDIDDCRVQAEKAGATPGSGKAGEVTKSTAIGAGIGAAGGAVGGAVVGSAGSGSAIGAASGAVWGLLGGLLRAPHPSEAYKGYVNRCLKEKGYDPTGWD